MRDAKSCVPPFALGEVMTGMSVGEVVAALVLECGLGDLDIAVIANRGLFERGDGLPVMSLDRMDVAADDAEPQAPP